MTWHFLLLAVFICLVFFAVLLPPLVGGWRRRQTGDGTGLSNPGVNDQTQHEQSAVLRARLSRIEADREAGFINDTEAAEAIHEAERGALKALDAADANKTTTDGSLGPSPSNLRAARFSRMAAVGFIVLAPLMAVLVYPLIGAPSKIAQLEQALPGAVAPSSAKTPAEAIASLSPADRQAAIENMVDGLAARLSAAPEDVDGWRMLARSQLVLGRGADSAESWRQLLGLVDGDRDDWLGFANARIAAEEAGAFPIDDEFMTILTEIDARQPGNPLVQFYRAGALLQQGDALGAASLWRDLLNKLPEDAPVRGALKSLIREAEEAQSKSSPR